MGFDTVEFYFNHSLGGVDLVFMRVLAFCKSLKYIIAERGEG